MPETQDPTLALTHLVDEFDGIVSGIAEGNLKELGQRISLLRRLAAAIDVAHYACQTTAAENMEDDYIHLPNVGWLVRKEKYSSSGSNAAGARRAARTEVARRLSVDTGTGEINTEWRSIATAAIDLYESAISLGNPKRGFHDVLGLNLDDYMVSALSGYSVELHQELPT